MMEVKFLPLSVELKA